MSNAKRFGMTGYIIQRKQGLNYVDLHPQVPAESKQEAQERVDRLKYQYPNEKLRIRKS